MSFGITKTIPAQEGETAVACPGERLPHPIPRQGHRGTRYYDGADWPW